MSPHTGEPLREPIYMDEFGGRHHPPPEPTYQKVPHPRYDYGPERRPRRAQTYRAPPPPSPPSSSSSYSPPPRHHRSRRSPRYAHKATSPEPVDRYQDHHAARRRHTREDDYYSDNRYNRPRRSSHSDSRKPYTPEDRHRRDRRERPPQPKAGTRPTQERKESVWQKEAKDMFKEYAVPVIKAEGGKYISKQIGNFIAKKA
ncbi:unnamed protein product [Periconia digitata]|uniref:Uncharacterized protein n=1 Tax=Periconia digitata TaxID=1303443 RepID=A0A9W4UHD8_9PLEO|nr:unnamed protein product [Periconia digitata]